MAPRYDDMVGRLNGRITGGFGISAVFIDPQGGRKPAVMVDKRQEQVLIQTSHGEAVSTTRPFLGLDLSTWVGPAPNTDWTLEIGRLSPDPEGWSGRWEIADASKRGGQWLDLELSNRTSL